MRITIVCVPAAAPGRLEAAAKAMARTLEAKGHEVELHTGDRGEAPRLAMSDYVVLGTEPLGLGGRLPSRIAQLLAQVGGGLAGKRSMAFVLKRGPLRNKTLPRLMKAMEAEGMSVNYGEVVSGPAEAARAAEAAPLERHR